ncbi:MAG: transposase [archaeon]|nr:transposase [archaeon]
MKEVKLVIKVKRLLKRGKIPKWLHHFGPKKYEFWTHFFCLLLKQACKMSYRRVSKLLAELGFKVPTYSALCKSLKRLTVKQLELLLQATNQFKKTLVAAVDGFYFSQVNPSFAYLDRIKRGFPRKNTQCVGIIDTKRKKWLGVTTRRKPRGEYRLAEKLLTKLLTLIEILVADKGFDVNQFYKSLKKLGIKGIIPVKKGTHKGFFRNFMRKFFRTRTYHRRSIIESAISRLKRLYGNFLYSKNTLQQRKEILLRLIADNLNIGSPTSWFKFIEIFN